MNTPEPPAANPTELLCQAATQHAQRLLALLEAEFEALKKQNLNAFEALQAEKAAVLQTLAQQAEQIQAQENSAESTAWADFKDQIRVCRDRHRRNESLINRQLTAIRGALQALSPNDALQSLEVYDRLGQISRRGGARGYTEA